MLGADMLVGVLLSCLCCVVLTCLVPGSWLVRLFRFEDLVGFVLLIELWFGRFVMFASRILSWCLQVLSRCMLLTLNVVFDLILPFVSFACVWR